MLSFSSSPGESKFKHQLELERLFNKNQLLHRIRMEFADCKDPDFINYMKDQEIPEKFGLELLVQMVLHRSTTLPVLVSILRHHFDMYASASQVTADMLQVAAEADLVDWNPNTQRFILKFDISDDVKDDLERFQFPLPMVVRPRKLHSNDESAYLSGAGSVILKKNHHEDDVCLDHLNRVNRVKFSLDLNTATMVQNTWRNLDKPKPGETKADFEKRKKAFDKYDRTAKDVMALLTQEGNEFYLTHKYDKRGRVYCQGYHVNYQGAPWNKAVIQLAEKEIVP